ncbi:MAG: oxidoreductase [Alphaproteobacteria bacterium]|nr:oxidoreductase [Alphaproteobacteria bacterium]
MAEPALSSTESTSRLAWVTGASRGIGYAVARALAADGWVVAVSARNAADLETLARECGELKGEVRPYPLDITDAFAVSRTFAAIEADLGNVGLAILNAGTHEPVDGRSFAIAPFRRLMEVNYMGAVNCLAPVVEHFVARGTGRIAVVASLAGYRGLPTASAYGASKAALINMCEALHPELDAVGVILSVVTPGFVRTQLTDKNSFPMPFLINADTAARRIVRGLKDDRFEITFPRRFAFLMKLFRVLPYRIFFAFTRRIRPMLPKIGGGTPTSRSNLS